VDRVLSRGTLFLLAAFVLALAFPHLAQAAAYCEISCMSLDGCGSSYCQADGPSATCCCTGTGEAFCSSYPVPMTPCEYTSSVSTYTPHTSDQLLKAITSPQSKTGMT
jgi:hypothetical protein